MASPIGRVLLMDKGAYNGSTVYNQLDWVRYNGAAWVCKVNGTVGVQPVEGANWTLLAQDGTVSGAVEWSSGVLYKPFENIGSGLSVDGSDNLNLDISYLIGSNIGYDNTTSGLTASNTQDAIDELAGMSVDLSTDLLAGSNITLTTKPDGKVEIASTGGGGGGSSTFAGLDDTDITNPQADQIVQYKSVGGQMKLQNVNMPQGGHTMIPTTNDIATITGLQNGNDNYVINAYSAKRWSNAEVMTLFTTVAQGRDTVGTWDDNWTGSGASRSGWLWHSALHGILSDDEVEITFVFDVNNNGADSETVSVYAYRVDDDVQNGGVDGGAIAIKLNGAIQNASGVKIGVNLKRQRTEVGNLTVL